MIKLPEYAGPIAIGIKMGVILPGMNIEEKVFEQLARCRRDGLLHDGDIVCITESVVARAQNNYITPAHIAAEIQKKLSLSPGDKVAVVFPIASRNRFAMILEGIAAAVPGGGVVVQFSFPRDEVGNQVICPVFASELGKAVITAEDLAGREFKHPITGVNYLNLYREIIEAAGARAEIVLCNDPLHVLSYNPGGIIAADIHTRAATKEIIVRKFKNCITLDEICTTGEARSEWGVLGSNMAAGGKIKLAPRDGDKIVRALQRRAGEELGVALEFIIYGDGAYRDPSSGIYELADPKPAFAATAGLNCFRRGIKYKYLADHYFHELGKSAGEIEALLEEKRKGELPDDCIEKEGTTPRRMEDILASLADLISGSADAGTPVVLIKGF